MRNLFKTFTCVTAIALSGAAYAQETPTEDKTTDQAASQVDPTISMGEEVGEGQVGQTYAKATHGDWELRCARAPEGQKDPCQLYQLLRDGEDNSVAEISIFALQNEKGAAAGATIVTPLETLLTQQLRVSVDSAKAKRYPFSWCSPAGCFARIGFTPDDISAFKRGAAAKLTIVPVVAPDQTVDLKISLTGFTAGFDAMMAWNTAE
ncbi:invasion associated locus B family protein [Actibacterium lipolyticum]|uniref:Invasion associated locus B (IalB) protein n=1 Tax=Actibacterium lipolyticum TaxID=1524263 RepID=A0A238JYI5_9RHOB|nr:invasion associated locus B family protein [Actibacterium lipolyticum]SMX34902.1 Invasion associated locus B (IalB) protein [Actibacterium lipolyticum]